MLKPGYLQFMTISMGQRMKTLFDFWTLPNISRSKALEKKTKNCVFACFVFFAAATCHVFRRSLGWMILENLSFLNPLRKHESTSVFHIWFVLTLEGSSLQRQPSRWVVSSESDSQKGAQKAAAPEVFPAGSLPNPGDGWFGWFACDDDMMVIFKPCLIIGIHKMDKMGTRNRRNQTLIHSRVQQNRCLVTGWSLSSCWPGMVMSAKHWPIFLAGGLRSCIWASNIDLDFSTHYLLWVARNRFLHRKKTVKFHLFLERWSPPLVARNHSPSHRRPASGSWPLLENFPGESCPRPALPNRRWERLLPSAKVKFFQEVMRMSPKIQ